MEFNIPTKSQYLNHQASLIEENLEMKAEKLLQRIAKELEAYRPTPFTFYIHQEVVLPRNAEYSKYTGQYKAILDYVCQFMKEKGWSISFTTERGNWGEFDDNTISVTIQ